MNIILWLVASVSFAIVMGVLLIMFFVVTDYIKMMVSEWMDWRILFRMD